MKANLDKWIKDAKNDVPESGEYRRLNRAILKERMAKMAPRRRRRHRVLLGVLSLVFLMFYSGQLNQLGSDDFDLILEDWVSPLGKDVPVAKHQFSGQSFTGLEDLSTEDLDEFYRTVSAGEGEIVWVQGTSYGGNTKWLKYVKRVVNGKIVNQGHALDDRPFVEPDNYLEFLKKYVYEIENKTRSIPHQRETVMTFDGVICNVKIWVFHFPEYGEVIRYLGTPTQKNF